MSVNETRAEWRCRACHTLLGVARGDHIEVRFKAAGFIVRGEVTTKCRRCGTRGVFTTSAAGEPSSSVA